MIPRFLLTALLLTLCHPTRSQFVLSDACQTAYEACRFRFATRQAGVLGLNLRGPPDVPFSPPIFRIGRDVRGVNSNGVVTEIINDEGVSISTADFGTPPFTPTHFKPVNVAGGGVALVHEAYSGNQRLFVSGGCVRTFFTHYQVVEDGRTVNVALSEERAREENSCIVYRGTFTTESPSVDV